MNHASAVSNSCFRGSNFSDASADFGPSIIDLYSFANSSDRIASLRLKFQLKLADGVRLLAFPEKITELMSSVQDCASEGPDFLPRMERTNVGQLPNVYRVMVAVRASWSTHPNDESIVSQAFPLSVQTAWTTVPADTAWM